MVAIGNPVEDLIRPPGSPFIANNMRVTQDAASHVARGGPPALDIGDGDPDLDAILSPHNGVVSQAFTVGSANLSIDFDSGGKKWRVVLAHNTLPHPVKVGQPVTEGQVVGRMGSTSSPTMPVPIHLHMQLGYLNGSTWLWVDPWPYLRQNGATEEDMQPIPIGNYQPVVNKLSSVSGANGANFRADRFINAAVLKLYPKGVPFTPLCSANDGSAAGGLTPTLWYGGLSGTDSGVQFGWFHSSILGPFTDTSPDCAAEVLKAVTPLERRLKDISVIASS